MTVTTILTTITHFYSGSSGDNREVAAEVSVVRAIPADNQLRSGFQTPG